MAQKKNQVDSFKNFSDALDADRIGCFYIFHGEERYLIDRMLIKLRSKLCPEGLDSFNYKRFEGKSLSVDELDAAIDMLPSFAERTFIEVHDFDLFATGDKSRQAQLVRIFANLPEYVCILFCYDTIQFKPDRRVKVNAEILKYAQVVEFVLQEQTKILKWIKVHYRDAGKSISDADAKYLVFITGGYMSALDTEIEKTAAFAKGDAVTREDIDAVVTPVLDAVAYKLTDALAEHRHADAMRVMDELFQMKEPPHKLIFSISLKMRQLLAAKVCINSGLSKNDFIDMCGIRFEFQARSLMDTARKTSLEGCRRAVLFCSETALELNSESDPEARMTELITRLATI